MPTSTPEEVMHAFFRAFNKGDFEAVMAVYEPGAVMVAQPGHVTEGNAGLRAAVNAFLSMKATLTLEKYKLVTASELALAVIQWNLKGTGLDGKPVQMAGTSSDVLRKQSDGRWLFVIDNPWGAGIIGSTAA